MRLGPLSLLVAAVLLVGAPVLAQNSNPPPSNGGLTVCCGGTFGYIGGSGGVSGHVVGPGGGSRTVQPAPVTQEKPSALNSGVVSKAKLPVARLDANTASTSAHPDALSWVMIALLALGALFLYRKLPRTA